MKKFERSHKPPLFSTLSSYTFTHLGEPLKHIDRQAL
jgi:hypothetical protein